MRRAAALLAIATLPGCATLLGGGRTSFEARVAEPPPGVAIRVNGLENGERHVAYEPIMRVRLDRASAYIVIAEAPGHEAAEHVVVRTPSWWLLGDVLLGAPLVMLGWPLNLRPFPGGPDVFSATGAGVSLLALAVDLATGNAWSHAERRVVLRLARSSPRP